MNLARIKSYGYLIYFMLMIVPYMWDDCKRNAKRFFKEMKLFYNLLKLSLGFYDEISEESLQERLKMVLQTFKN